MTGAVRITACRFDDDAGNYPDTPPNVAQRYAVGLPYRFSGPRPRAKLTSLVNGQSVECEVAATRPWFADDNYWDKGTRPIAESHPTTNGAGIDVTPPVDALLGLNGKGLVDLDLIEPPGNPQVTPMPDNSATIEQLRQLLPQIMEAIRQQPPSPPPTPAPPQGGIGSIIKSLMDAYRSLPAEAQAQLQAFAITLITQLLARLMPPQQQSSGSIGFIPGLITAMISFWLGYRGYVPTDTAAIGVGAGGTVAAASVAGKTPQSYADLMNKK